MSALTAKEWEQKAFLLRSGEVYKANDDEIGVRPPKQAHSWRTRLQSLLAPRRSKVNTAILNSPEQRAMAALCLHGQSFGFTRADVEWLRNLAYIKPPGGASTRDQKNFSALADDLARRIEALVPPEDEE